MHRNPALQYSMCVGIYGKGISESKEKLIFGKLDAVDEII